MSRSTRAKILHFALVALIGFGWLAAARLSWVELQSAQGCPKAGPVPICFVVLAGYSALAVSLLAPTPWVWVGLLLAGGPAIVGTTLQATVGDACPVGPAGVPLCYVSLAMVLVFVGLFFGARRLNRLPARKSS